MAKNAFPEISAWKNQIKISQHVALPLNLGVLKNCLLALGGGGQLPPTSHGPALVLYVFTAFFVITFPHYFTPFSIYFPVSSLLFM